MATLCDEPLINRFFSIVGRLGVFGLLMDAEQDLTLHQLRVLFRLHYRGSVGMGQIAEQLQVTQPTATGVIDRLVERGLVERASDPSDRRKVRVKLTETGRRQVTSMRCAGAEIAQSAFDQLTQEQRDALFQALEPVYQLLTPSDENES